MQVCGPWEGPSGCGSYAKDGLFRETFKATGVVRRLLTLGDFDVTLDKWQDSLRVESVITKSTHFVALPEYPRNSPHRAAWVSS